MPDWKAHIRAAFAAAGQTPAEDIADIEEVVEELSQHAAATYETARADGRSAADAARQVEMLLAAVQRDPAAFRRRPRRPPPVDPPPAPGRPFSGIVHDIRYAWRLLRREPGHAALGILTTALGIGATTALFSVTSSVLLKPLPWPDADRLVRITESRQGHASRIPSTVSNGTYLAWRDHPSTIEEIGGWRTQTMTMTGVGEPDRLQIVPVTPSLLTVLRAHPAVGRPFRSDEGARGQPGLVLLSYGLWQERFGGRADVAGRAIQLDGQPYTIIGVMPRDFAFPDRRARAWTPLAVPAVSGADGTQTMTIFSAMARLRPTVTASQAGAEATARGRAAPDSGMAGLALFGSKGPVDVTVAPALTAMTREVRPAILLLLAAVVLLCATATANVASLQLARSTTRRHELAIRAAIGAGSGRLMRQLLVESVMIGVAGGAAGVGLAFALTRALPAVLPADFPRLETIAIDAPVLLFALGLSLVVSLTCGLMPALQTRRVNLVESLSEDGIAPLGGTTRTRTARARAVIMAGQVAVACVLLVSAVLLTRSFVALIHADRGYDPVNLMTARVPLPQLYTPQRRVNFLNMLLERLRAVPGVTDAAAGNALPFVSAGGFSAFTMRSPRDPGVQIDVQAVEHIVSPGYFGALKLRVVAGRPLMETDTATSPPVLVVNRTFARTYLGDQPIGERIPQRGGSAHSGFRSSESHADLEVVGVVDDMRPDTIDAPLQPEMFLAYRQVMNGNARAFDPLFVIRTREDPAPYVATLRALVSEQDPSLALDSVMTMEDRVMTSLARPRTYAVLLGVFAVLAAAIAGVGLFGVLSYSVAQRTREIGVRTALGARPGDIAALVLRQAFVMTLGGLAAGMWVAFAVGRSLSKFLYGVTGHDTITFVAVPGVLMALAAIACVIPARRAARVDPLRALRS